MFVREGKFKWMAPKKCIKDEVQGGNEKQYTIKREREVVAGKREDNNAN